MTHFGGFLTLLSLLLPSFVVPFGASNPLPDYEDTIIIEHIAPGITKYTISSSSMGYSSTGIYPSSTIQAGKTLYPICTNILA